MLQAGLDEVLEGESTLGDAIASVAPEITKMNATKLMAPALRETSSCPDSKRRFFVNTLVRMAMSFVARSFLVVTEGL